MYTTIILPIVLYGCETLSLALREEHKLRVFENGVRRRISGRKGEEVARGWRRLHNEELRNLYTSLNVIMVNRSRRMAWVVYVARMGEMRNAYNIFVVNPKEKQPT
jgi:hypothetical protein